uniref:Uncharacterized protein LOC103435023 n=1 Tax=Rhizophora mucronata TaxID=61149 RepID=A0A2P2JWN4_RHIMU
MSTWFQDRSRSQVLLLYQP